jgi:solute carrier family 35 protein F5
MPSLNISSYALGLVIIVLVAIIWSIASILVQYLYHNQDFHAPFLLTYIGTSLFVIQLPLNCLYKRWVEYRRCRNSNNNHAYESIPITSSNSPHPTAAEEEEQQEQMNTTATSTVEQEHRSDSDSDGNSSSNNNNNNSYYHWTERDHMIAAAKIAPVWFISNFAYNASLQYTSITSSTVLVNTGSLFTFLIALFMRDESFSYYKLIGVLFGMTGCILTGYHDAAGSGGGGSVDNRRLRFLFGDDDNGVGDDSNNDDDNNDRVILGDILSVVSAAFYGIYAVMVRVLCPHDESLMSMQLFLGYVGLWNMIFLSPIAIYQLGIARSVTLSAWVFGCVVIKGLFDNVLSDYLWARSVILTSATVASVGLGLTIPLAFFSDIFIGVEDVVNFESILGAGFVLFGFILVNMGQKQEEEEEGSTASSLTERYDDDNVGIECVSEEEDPARQIN